MIDKHRLPVPVRALVWADADALGERYADAVCRVSAAIGVTATVITPPAVAQAGG